MDMDPPRPHIAAPLATHAPTPYTPFTLALGLTPTIRPSTFAVVKLAEVK